MQHQHSPTRGGFAAISASARAMVLAGTVAASALFTTVTQAAVISLPADTMSYSFYEYDLSAYSGRHKLTVTSSRDMLYLNATTADYVDWHVHPLSGTSIGDGADWIQGNQHSYTEGPNFFSIVFKPRPSSYEIKCCWWSSGEMVPYEELYFVTSMLWANWEFAPGEDPITLTFDVTPYAVVPEPATWAMMIGGFGMAGAALRRSRSRTSASANADLGKV